MGPKKDKKGKRKATDAAADGEQQPAAAAPQQQQQHAGAKPKKQRQQQPGANGAGEGGDAARRAAFPEGRRYTVSLAVPGSVLDGAQSLEMASFIAGQVARAAALFSVDELVVVDDMPQRKDGTIGAAAAFLARVVQYLETPPYLRKALIPAHDDLRLAGQLPPLDTPHHPAADEWQAFREGVVSKVEEGYGSFVDVGLDRTALVEGAALRAGARVTLRLGEAPAVKFVEGYGESMLLAEVAAPSAPREEAGLYWGFTTRLAKGISGLVRECPFEGGYDLKLGVSEHGQVVLPGNLGLPKFQHLLVAIGGAGGLEGCLASDKRLQKSTVTDVFDVILNTCPGGGSRSVRGEEAALVSMGFLQTAVGRFGER